MKIIQNGRTITADFTDLENQYSSGTIVIPVEFNDTTFEDYQMFYSAQLHNFETYNYIAQLVDNNIVLPLAVMYYQGTITISLYGIKGNLTLTTNNIAFNIIESNPTADQVRPEGTDWAQAVKEYTNAYAAEKYRQIVPTIHPETKHWHIGGVDTGVLAEGSTGMRRATQTSIGGIAVGNSLKISRNGTLDVDRVKKTITLSSSGWENKVYTLRDEFITTTSKQTIIPVPLTNPPTENEVEYIEKLTNANIVAGNQYNGWLFLIALGEVPTTDLNVVVIFEK